MTLNLRQPRNSEPMYDILARARLEYPHLHKEKAVVKLIESKDIKDVFFLDEEGKRCVLRETVYHQHRQFLLMDHDGVQCNCCSRRFLVRKEDVSEMKIANRPKLKHISRAVKHFSEDGWKLDQDHPRHFLKFPQEIQDLIFKFALCIPSWSFIHPRSVTSNWKSELRQPDYSTSNCHDVDTYSLFLNVVARLDRDGKYYEIRDVFRKEIDATILRTCKKFHEDGQHLLYSKNAFRFRMVNEYCHNSPPSYYWSEKMFRPCPIKPPPIEEAIILTLSDIRNREAATKLEGRVYYDHFLHFLWTIGPRNAGLIKSLEFRGVVKLHNCDSEDCGTGRCYQGLKESLMLYIPVMRLLCTGLEKLTIVACKDSRHHQIVPAGTSPEDMPDEHEDAIKELLEEVKSLETLKELVVFGNGSLEENMDIAKETIEYIKNRAEEKARARWAEEKKGEEIEQAKIKQVLVDQTQVEMVWAANVHCAFCGEGHVWVECYNLCSYCGDFKHERKGCQERIMAGEPEE